MRIGALGGCEYHRVILVLLASGNRYDVDTNSFFLIVKTLYDSLHS
jgi:hypothetical protein